MRILEWCTQGELFVVGSADGVVRVYDQNDLHMARAMKREASSHGCHVGMRTVSSVGLVHSFSSRLGLEVLAWCPATARQNELAQVHLTTPNVSLDDLSHRPTTPTRVLSRLSGLAPLSGCIGNTALLYLRDGQL